MLFFAWSYGTIKVEKWQSRIFEKKSLICRYSRKDLQISPKSDFAIFLKNGFNDYFGFWPEVSTKYDLRFEWNLFFRRKLQFGDIWPRNRQNIAQIEVFGHFIHFVWLVFLDFAHNDRWTWCLCIFLQFAGPVDAFLLTSISIFELPFQSCFGFDL